VNKVAAFWDASALVPLCAPQTTSIQAHSNLRRFLPVVWWGSAVEVHSAIMRLQRSGKLTDGDVKSALNRLGILIQQWREVLPTDRLREEAMLLLDVHDLRAADSLQLAAALIWCHQRPARRNFVCGDHRLLKAANALGFSVSELWSP
jgi:uncharacterized protein